MFNITKDLIKKNATSAVYERGLLYFKYQNVLGLRYDSEENKIIAHVEGSEIYETSVFFNEENKARSYSCTCPYDRFCKHAVALMLEIEKRDNEGYFDTRVLMPIKQNPIFDFFDIKREMRKKLKAEIEATITIETLRYNKNDSVKSLSLRTGTKKLYVVKNIREFAANIINGIPMEFGKDFNFDPSTHEYNDNDMLLLNYINELSITEEHLKPAYKAYGNSYSGGKNLSIPDFLANKILDLYINREVNIIFNGDSTSVSVVNENTPFDFALDMQDANLVLDIDFTDVLTVIDPTFNYTMLGNKVYKNSREHRLKIEPFIKAMIHFNSSRIIFNPNERERFVSEILPLADDIGNVKIEESVRSLIKKIPLQAEIYLDRTSDNYTAEVKFIYGDRTINPFAPAAKSDDIPETILARDIKKETSVLDILANTEFKVRGDRLYCENEDDLFDFLTYGLSEISEHANVFYSDAVKGIKIKKNVSMKGSVSLSAETNLLDFDFSFDGIDQDELKNVLISMKEKKRFHKLRNGSFMDLRTGSLEVMSNFMESLGLSTRDISNGSVSLPAYRALYLDENIRDYPEFMVERNHRFKELVQNISEPQDMDFVLPEKLDDVMRGYQKFGFKWLKTLSHYNMGGILADDMGLGKTLQVLSFILSDKTPDSKPSLIIAPTSLLFNWEAEIKKFVPSLKSIIIYGNADERAASLKSIKNYDLAITSYPLIRRDIDMYNELIFETCIIDEAQHIKNHHSQTARALKTINAKTRFALTGTPMENNLSELWSIFDFIMPQYLQSHGKFSRNYEVPIIRNADTKAMHELSRHIKPFILRRMKKDVLKELPDKIESKMVSELTTDQKKVYLSWLLKIKGEVFGEIDTVGFEKSQIKILAGLTRLRQICCHPSLFIDNYKKDSGKLLQLEEIVCDAVDSGHRILIFSQFTSMLAIISETLKKNGIECFYLDGSTKADERGRLVNTFNEGNADVFLISLKAGGTGLNLTGADMVIHYDPWWNPAVEDQATDRAHRIGQEKAVQVIKLITAGTIEEKIFNLQQKKKALVDSVIKPGETLITKLSKAEVEDLFSV